MTKQSLISEIAQALVALIIVFPIAIVTVQGKEVAPTLAGLAGLVVGWYFRRGAEVVEARRNGNGGTR